MPLNLVPGEPAGVASADADADGDGSADAADADGDADGVDALHAVRTRIGMIAAATKRYRDTAWGPPLDILRVSSSILNGRRYAGQYADGTDKVKISHAVQQVDRWQGSGMPTKMSMRT